MRDQINFQQPLPAHWRITNYGNGRVMQQPDALHLTLPTSDATRYHDAQLTDYVGKGDFRWRPPLRMEVVASASLHPLVGTAGFGFWNHPFVPGERGVRLPKAVWFFLFCAT